MSKSRPLPNFFALYLLPWAFMSWSVARLWGIEVDRQDKSTGDKAGLDHASAEKAVPDVQADKEVLTPDEEVRLLHILE
jgi:hypothetical protein